MLERHKWNPKSPLTATTLAGPSIKHGVLGGYILLKNDENAQKFKQHIEWWRHLSN